MKESTKPGEKQSRRSEKNTNALRIIPVQVQATQPRARRHLLPFGKPANPISRVHAARRPSKNSKTKQSNTQTTEIRKATETQGRCFLHPFASAGGGEGKSPKPFQLRRFLDNNKNKNHGNHLTEMIEIKLKYNKQDTATPPRPPSTVYDSITRKKTHAGGLYGLGAKPATRKRQKQTQSKIVMAHMSYAYHTL